ncbi:hypothetical protein GGX14DRAFT_444658 [Mycena pura]|uniref:Uncharacterized protein n=1 Tax=Mycena pura TaxID=153505 RepID=A0AAD6VIL8_9AGAR|nr:hypothetical protein GGX14DRAFT_444658 [Mycena pura]
MSNLDDEYMVPPGLSSITNSTTAPLNDLFGRTSTPSRHSPPPASAPPSSHRPPFGRTPVLPAQNMSNSNNAPETQSGIFTNGGPRPGRHFLRDKPPPPPPSGAHRPDLPMDGMNDGFRSPIRIPDSANEYDPRRRDPIILGPTSSYSLSNSSPSIPPAPAYQRWMSYSGPSSASAVYHQPYSPLVSLNSRMSPQLLPPSPSAHHVTSGPAIEVIGARPPSRQFSSTPEVPAFNSQTPIPIPTARLPSPRRSFSNDSLFNPSSKPPSPSSHAMLPPTTVDRVVVPQARPAVTYAPRVTPPEVDSAPEVEMGNYETSTSPRRSPSPAVGSSVHALPKLSTSGAPHATSSTPAPNAAFSPRSPSPTRVSRVPEIDMRSLENSLIERLKGELRSQLKDELKDELKGELRGELRDELRGELKNELKGEIVGQMEEELPGRMKHQLLGQLKAELLGQIKDDLLHQLKDELFVQMKAELLTHMKAELVHQLKDELLFQLKDELLRQLQEELLVLLKNELKVQLADDLTTTVKNNLRGQLRADLRDDMVDELKDHFTAQLQDQLKALLLRLQHAMNSQLRDDLTIQLKYFIAKLKEELIVQLKDTLTVHLQDGLITQVKTALTAQLRDGLGAQREQLNLDFERRRLFLEQQPRTKAVKPASPAVTTPSRATPTTPRPLPSLLFQARHPLHHLVLTAGPDPTGMDVDVVPPPTPPISLSPSKPRGSETPLPVKSQRKQSFFAAGYQASPPA